MLAIRLQPVGRKKMHVYRVAVQESHRHPSSGRVVAYVGTFNPHNKQIVLNKEKVEFYLGNGANPSPRVIRLLESEKIALPAWVKKNDAKQRTIRNPEKLRKNKPAEETAPADVPKESTAETPVSAEAEVPASEPAANEAKTE